jgi:hypothetical protein
MRRRRGATVPLPVVMTDRVARADEIGGASPQLDLDGAPQQACARVSNAVAALMSQGIRTLGETGLLGV